MTARFVDLGHDGVESPIDGVESRIDRVELRIATCGISIASGDAQAFGEVGAAVAVDGGVPLARESEHLLRRARRPLSPTGSFRPDRVTIEWTQR